MSKDLLFEIGAEEIPPGYVPPALEQLERAAREGLVQLRLSFGDLIVHGAPRRLALVVSDLADRQDDFDEEVTGPAARVAFDAEGKPTKALLGFCQSKGIDPAQVRTVETPKGAYVTARVHHAGRAAAEVLPPLLAQIAGGLQFPKSMRWIPGSQVRFARPARWIVALLGDQVLPVEALGVTAGRASRGHRFLAPEPVEIAAPRRYLETLERVHVRADHRARRAALEAGVEQAARSSGGAVWPDPELVEINTFLAEWPSPVLGGYEPGHASELPNEVIVQALREHQRAFAVVRAGDGGTLEPRFVSIRDGDPARGADNVRRGNEQVVAARLADARFYWTTDLARTPEQRLESLAGIVWMEGLGTLRDKADRLVSLATWLAGRMAPAAAQDAAQAARLAKTDLASEMIGSGKEYAALQGTIGAYYAARAGEPPPVSRAIAEHYRPRWADDALPGSDAGAVLAMADRLDHVAGAFVAGKVPTGSEDPYGVRRAGNGVVRILIDQGRPLDLYMASMEATRPLFAADPNLPHAEIMKELGTFWRSRVEAALDERGIAYDLRDAAVEARIPVDGGRTRPGWVDPADAVARARALAAFRADARFESLVILFKRVANILKAATETLPERVDAQALAEPAERELLAALERARSATEPHWNAHAYAEIIPALLAMEPAIHGFFEHVFVNVDDLKVRANRLRLLSEVRGLFLRGWDLSRVVVEG